MILTNYHIHTSYCDGHGEMQAFVDEALRLGLRSIGFSSHAPLPFATGWTMPSDRLAEYLEEIARLKAANASPLEIYSGLEVDYLPDCEASPLGTVSPQAREPGASRPDSCQGKMPDNPRVDYVIGAVHFVGGESDHYPWTVDGPIERFDDGLSVLWSGDIRGLVCEYFRRTRAMVELCSIDVVGHLDRVLYDNVGDRLFSASAPWYREQVEQTLAAIAARDLIVELNLAGLYAPLGQPNPAPLVLKRCRELGIRIVVTTDAHWPQHVARGLDRAERLLCEAGYHEAWRLNRGRWCPENLGQGS